MPFTPKFADLVRASTATTGTGNFVLGSSPTGFRTFASAVVTGDQFYYSCIGVDVPGETEIGRGTMQSDGTIARAAVTGGSLTTFSAGAKILSLVSAAEWFTGIGAGSSGVGLPDVQLFANIGTATVPAGVLRIRTLGRTVVGSMAGTYTRSADTTALGAYASAIVAALPSGQQAAATTDLLAIMSRIRIQSVDGAWWEIDDSLSDAHGGHFGMVEGVSNNYAAGTVTGTDAWAAGQALIDWRTYVMKGTPSGAKDCILPPGNFRTLKGWQASYGDTFTTVRIRGAGSGIFGTTLWSDFDNQPVITIQGGRKIVISGVNIISPMGRAWIYNKGIGTNANTSMVTYSLDDKDRTVWNDPTQPNRSAVLRWNPHAAIAIDPYYGSAPSAASAWATSTATVKGTYKTANSKLFLAQNNGTTAASGSGPNATGGIIIDGTVIWSYAGASTQAIQYPSATPPAFLPAAAQITYGKSALTSKVILSDVSIDGYAVGVAQLGTYQDDFISFVDVDITNTAVPVAIGGAQARNNDFVRFNPNTFHTMFDGQSYGTQSGRTGGVWNDCSASGGIQLFSVGIQGSSGQLTFLGFYCEAIWRQGQVGTAGASPTSVMFIGGQQSFGFQATTNGARGVPQYMVGRDDSPGGGGTDLSPVTLRDVDIGTFEGLFPMRMNRVICDNVSFTPNDAYSVSTQWRSRALNTLAGGLIMPRLEVEGDQRIRYLCNNETSLGNTISVDTRPRNKFSSRDYPASMYTPSLSPSAGSAIESIVNPLISPNYPKSDFTSVGLSGRTLTMTMPSYMDTQRANREGYVPGGVLWDDSQGHVFIIQTRTGSSGSFVLTCQLQNGYWYNNAGAIQYEFAFSTSAGNFYSMGGGLFTPPMPLFGNVTTSNQTISSITNGGDYYGGFINTSTGSGGSQVQVGDILYRDKLTNIGLDGGPGYAVPSGGLAAASINAGDYFQVTATNRRFPLWIRGS